MGNDPKPRRLHATSAELPANKYDQLATPGTREGVSWGDADAHQLLRAVIAVVEDGGALILGRTSDQGALMISLMNGVGRWKLYPASADELEKALGHLETLANSP